MEKETLSTVPGFEPWSFDCRSTALTNWATQLSWKRLFPLQKDFKLQYLKILDNIYTLNKSLLKLCRFLLSINRFVSLLKNSSVKCKTKIVLPINDSFWFWKEILQLLSDCIFRLTKCACASVSVHRLVPNSGLCASNFCFVLHDMFFYHRNYLTWMS